MSHFVVTMNAEDVRKLSGVALRNQLTRKLFYDFSRSRRRNTNIIHIVIKEDSFVASSMKEILPPPNQSVPIIPIFEKESDIIIRVEGSFDFVCSMGSYRDNIVLSIEQKQVLN